MSNHPDIGTEFDWLASDKNGRVALMSTAGFGCCPEEVSNKIDVVEKLLAWILEEIGLKGGDLLLAEPERGIIVFDWKHWEGPYKRLYVPRECINKTTLEQNLLPVEAVHPLNLDFLETEEISENEINTEKA